MAVQFTLYGKLKGNKPDFHLAAPGGMAQPLFDRLVALLRKDLGPARVQTGVFGAHMHVDIANDGPVTLMLDSNARDPGAPPPALGPSWREGLSAWPR